MLGYFCTVVPYMVRLDLRRDETEHILLRAVVYFFLVNMLD